MDRRRTSQIGGIAGAILLMALFPGLSARAQFAPVNKARSLEKSVIEGDEEVRKLKTGHAEMKSAKPATVKPKAAKATASKSATLKKASRQSPPKTAPTKSVAAKPAAPKPATPIQAQPKTLIAAARPAPKKRRQRIRYVKPMPFIVIDSVDQKGLLPGISEEGRFVYLRVAPETVFRVGNQVVPVTSLVEGMKLDCWGGWEKAEPDVYATKGAVVKGRLDDFALRLKINEACQRLSRPRATVAATTAQPAPAPEPAAKPEEKKPDEKKPEELKPGEPTTGEPSTGEPKPVDPNAPPANPEEPKPAEPGNP